jgi:hypothetical protein
MRETEIVRRLRAYENETGPVTLRGLRDDAAVAVRDVCGCGGFAAAVADALVWFGIVDMQINGALIRQRGLQLGCNSGFVLIPTSAKCLN